MASSSTYAFFQYAVEVPHCLLQHLSWDTTNFVLDSLFQFIHCPWPSRVDPILKVAPQEKITDRQIRWSWGSGNVTRSWDDTVTEQFSHSCHWLPCSVRCRTILLKPGCHYAFQKFPFFCVTLYFDVRSMLCYQWNNVVLDNVLDEL